MNAVKEGDIVLCTVDKIVGTSVFVKIEDDGPASIVVSEIAPGRIRNLRDYVVPNKRIVCKVIRIDDKGNIHLSLRRVTGKEKNEVLERYEKEKEIVSIIKAVAKERAQELVAKIKKESGMLTQFIEECKESSSKLAKYFSEKEAEIICKILGEKKEKKVQVKKEFLFSTSSPEGINLIRRILSSDKITYLAAGRFLIKVEAEDYKKANLEVQKILQDIQDKAKKEKADFSVKEK
jgi:translation initiation factor 2 alpha subunit (eIF-2alpha)